MKYALISPLDGTITQFTEIPDDSPPSLPPPKDSGNWHWLPVVQVPFVPPDPLIETVDSVTYEIQTDKVLQTTTIRPLIADEMDDSKNNHMSQFDPVTLHVTFNHENRIRTLESRAQLTMAQYKALIRQQL